MKNYSNKVLVRFFYNLTIYIINTVFWVYNIEYRQKRYTNFVHNKSTCDYVIDRYIINIFKTYKFY